jgi:hypothetical protein
MWAATSWAYTPMALIRAKPTTRATSTRRQSHRVVRHRLASHPRPECKQEPTSSSIPRRRLQCRAQAPTMVSSHRRK